MLDIKFYFKHLLKSYYHLKNNNSAGKIPLAYDSLQVSRSNRFL